MIRWCLLTLFPRLNDWVHHSVTQEISWSSAFCHHVIQFVALETVAVMCGSAGERGGGMCLVSFWKGFLGQIETLLNQQLPDVCKIVHQRLGIPLPTDGLDCYCMTTLRAKGLLTISAALAAGGADGLVEILRLPHRQKLDWGWLGSPTERHLQLIATSRASRRLHVLVEDLRPEIILPSGHVPTLREGMALGLKTRAEHVIASSCSEDQIAKWQEQCLGQMAWVRLLDFCEKEWNRLRVPHIQRCAVAQNMPSPILSSPVFWQHLKGIPKDGVSAEQVNAMFIDVVGQCSKLSMPIEQERLPGSAAPSEAVTLQTTLMKDWSYIRNELANNSDCAKNAAVPVFSIDVIQMFAESSNDDQLVDENLEDNATYELEQKWRRVAVDAVTVHLKKDNEINIMLPVAAELLLPGWKWQMTRPPTGHPLDPTWLVRHVSESVFKFFQSSSRGQFLPGEGHVVKHGVCRHKRQLVDLGQDTVVMKQARSDRAASSIEAHETYSEKDEFVLTEWSHAYVAMGLLFQHHLQTSLLARTCNLEVAACFLRSISSTIGCGVRMSALGATMRKD